MNLQKVFKNKTVLLTGHTGFKGSWLATWLQKMEAKVVGYSLPPSSKPSHIDELNLDIVNVEGDVRDLEKLKKTFSEHQPEIVLHLAAQSLVRPSYHNPIETYDTNVMGTLKVLEAARHCSSVRAIVNVTSDKCYENKEWPWGYRETDPMGGFDPYSSSKGCSEILTASFRNSYLPTTEYGDKHQVLLASARAGNVIGGGDWADNRLIPDAMRALAKGEALTIRSPRAIRPWQHVLEPLRGYLYLAAKLVEGDTSFAQGWNFGPFDENCLSVEQVLTKMKQHWADFSYNTEDNPFHEATFLKLDSSKAKQYLGFSPKLSIDDTLRLTSHWYREFYDTGKLLTHSQIDWYLDICKNQ